MIRQANIEDIEELSILRVEYQKAEAKENFLITKMQWKNDKS